MLWEDESVCNNDVLASGGGKNHNLGNVIRSQGIAASVRDVSVSPRHDGKVFLLRIDGVGLRLVSVESDDGELLLGD
jgi:hypothetical protein